MYKWLAFFLAVATLATFTWARAKYFRRSVDTERGRGGLAPFGTFFGVCGLVFIVVGDSLPTAGLFASFCIAVVGSQCLFWWAVFSFKGDKPSIAHTKGIPHAINKRGPYAYIRHPFYASYMLFWIGLSLFLGFESLVGGLYLFAPSVMGFLYFKVALREEREILGSELGADYLSYMRGTGMFVPFRASPRRD